MLRSEQAIRNRINILNARGETMNTRLIKKQQRYLRRIEKKK